MPITSLLPILSVSNKMPDFFGWRSGGGREKGQGTPIYWPYEVCAAA